MEEMLLGSSAEFVFHLNRLSCQLRHCNFSIPREVRQNISVLCSLSAFCRSDCWWWTCTGPRTRLCRRPPEKAWAGNWSRAHCMCRPCTSKSAGWRAAALHWQCSQGDILLEAERETPDLVASRTHDPATLAAVTPCQLLAAIAPPPSLAVSSRFRSKLSRNSPGIATHRLWSWRTTAPPWAPSDFLCFDRVAWSLRVLALTRFSFAAAVLFQHPGGPPWACSLAAPAQFYLLFSSYPHLRICGDTRPHCRTVWSVFCSLLPYSRQRGVNISTGIFARPPVPSNSMTNTRGTDPFGSGTASLPYSPARLCWMRFACFVVHRTATQTDWKQVAWWFHLSTVNAVYLCCAGSTTWPSCCQWRPTNLVVTQISRGIFSVSSQSDSYDSPKQSALEENRRNTWSHWLH